MKRGRSEASSTATTTASYSDVEAYFGDTDSAGGVPNAASAGTGTDQRAAPASGGAAGVGAAAAQRAAAEAYRMAHERETQVAAKRAMQEAAGGTITSKQKLMAEEAARVVLKTEQRVQKEVWGDNIPQHPQSAAVKAVRDAYLAAEAAAATTTTTAPAPVMPFKKRVAAHTTVGWYDVDGDLPSTPTTTGSSVAVTNTICAGTDMDGDYGAPAVAPVPIYQGVAVTDAPASPLNGDAPCTPERDDDSELDRILNADTLPNTPQSSSASQSDSQHVEFPTPPDVIKRNTFFAAKAQEVLSRLTNPVLQSGDLIALMASTFQNVPCCGELPWNDITGQLKGILLGSETPDQARDWVRYALKQFKPQDNAAGAAGVMR